MWAGFMQVFLTTGLVMTGCVLLGVGIGRFIAWRKERQFRKFLEED